MGTVKGDRRCQPFSRKVSYADRIVVIPPMPLPTTTPSRSGSTSGLPASFQASRAAMSANCSARSRRRASGRGITVAGSTAAGPANFTGTVSTQSSVRVLMPDRPSRSADQDEATSPPTGVVAPSPVTTTRTRSLLTLSSLLIGGAGRPAAPRGVSGARRPPPVEPGGTARAPADAAPLTAPADDPEPTSGEIRTG